MPVIHSLLRIVEDLEEEEDMVSPTQIALQFVDWTDPRRLVNLGKTRDDLESSEEESMMRNKTIHVDLAISILGQMKKGSSKFPPSTFLLERLLMPLCRGGTEGVVQYAWQIIHHCRSRPGKTPRTVRSCFRLRGR